MSTSGWIGFDLDGTLAEYGTFKGHNVIGPPVPLMVDRLKALRARGIECRIFTARVSDNDPATVKLIEDWCELHLGERLKVTNVKDYAMWLLYDDRAVAVEKNTGRILGFQEP
jgi:hypothetical protein